MKIGKVFENSKILLLAFFVLGLANFFGTKRDRPYFFISKQNSSINFNEKLILRFNLGLKRFLSSTLWISTILESDIDHYSSKDLNSWMFLRFNAIGTIDPLFYENYAFGGPYLSIVKDDLPGASYIFRKGLGFFPEDFNLLKSAGFHFYFEVGDPKTAYPLYKKLVKLAPFDPLISGVIARMEAAKGNLLDAFNMLNEMQKKFDLSTFVGKKIFEHRYAIKAELDLDCLNRKKLNCQRLDLEGNPYVYTSRGFLALKVWSPYRPKGKKIH